MHHLCLRDALTVDKFALGGRWRRGVHTVPPGLTVNWCVACLEGFIGVAGCGT